MADYRDQFDLIQRNAISSEDLVYIMMKYTPQIIHFSGHGSKEGLIFQDPQGVTQTIQSTVSLDYLELSTKRRKYRVFF